MSHLQSVADEVTVPVGAVKEQPVLLPADARDDLAIRGRIPLEVS
jgi:hypothetical protein